MRVSHLMRVEERMSKGQKSNFPKECFSLKGVAKAQPALYCHSSLFAVPSAPCHLQFQIPNYAKVETLDFGLWEAKYGRSLNISEMKEGVRMRTNTNTKAPFTAPSRGPNNTQTPTKNNAL